MSYSLDDDADWHGKIVSIKITTTLQLTRDCSLVAAFEYFGNSEESNAAHLRVISFQVALFSQKQQRKSFLQWLMISSALPLVTVIHIL